MRDLQERVAWLATGEEQTFPAEVAHELIHRLEPVRVLRQHRGLTQPQLAAAAGISAPYFSQLESGKCSEGL